VSGPGLGLLGIILTLFSLGYLIREELAGIREELAGIRKELARLRGMVP
jgi:hypothetical protein